MKQFNNFFLYVYIFEIIKKKCDTDKFLSDLSTISFRRKPRRFPVRSGDEYQRPESSPSLVEMRDHIRSDLSLAAPHTTTSGRLEQCTCAAGRASLTTAKPWAQRPADCDLHKNGASARPADVNPPPRDSPLLSVSPIPLIAIGGGGRRLRQRSIGSDG